MKSFEFDPTLTSDPVVRRRLVSDLLPVKMVYPWGIDSPTTTDRIMGFNFDEPE